VLETGGDEDQAIAGLLHDAPEDCGGREILEQIERRFGPRVAGIVSACTDTFEEPKPPWRARKERYIEHLVSDAPPEALLVSLADKVHNSGAILADYRAIGEELWSRFRGGKQGTLWYYRALLDAYRQRPDAPTGPVRDLERILAELGVLVALADEPHTGETP
jgi:(p)ppGpp synthase/HD superfamily hydrolase